MEVLVPFGLMLKFGMELGSEILIKIVNFYQTWSLLIKTEVLMSEFTLTDTIGKLFSVVQITVLISKTYHFGMPFIMMFWIAVIGQIILLLDSHLSQNNTVELLGNFKNLLNLNLFKILQCLWS